MAMSAPCDFKGKKFVDSRKVHLPQQLNQAGSNLNSITEYSKSMMDMATHNMNAAPHKVLSTGNN